MSFQVYLEANMLLSQISALVGKIHSKQSMSREDDGYMDFFFILK